MSVGGDYDSSIGSGEEVDEEEEDADDYAKGDEEDEGDELDYHLDPSVEKCLRWTAEEVAEWIDSIGFANYRDCFLSNVITGRRLIMVDASLLPKIGVTDFVHIKAIAQKVRDLLHIDAVPWNRSISLPPQSIQGMFLQSRCPTGDASDSLTFKDFAKRWPDSKFRPPLSNYCSLLPKD